jgi:hypothetical protein
MSWQRIGSKSAEVRKMQPEATTMRADAPPKAVGKVRLRTLAALDGRTTAAKRAAALAKTFAAELGGNLTPAQRIRVETAAALSAIAEDAQTRRLAGDPAIVLDDLVRAVSAARRAVKDLGLPKTPPASGPTLASYLASRSEADDE